MSCPRYARFLWQLHSWGKWTDKEQGDLLLRNTRTGEAFKNGYYLVQERVCAGCGLKQLRTLGTK